MPHMVELIQFVLFTIVGVLRRLWERLTGSHSGSGARAGFGGWIEASYFLFAFVV